MGDVVLGLASLQGTYDASGAAPHVTVDATNGGVVIRDNAVPIGADLFAVVPVFYPLGRPKPRPAMMFRCTSDVPAAIL